MNELKKVISKNISMLRKQAGYTQLELAEMLNYSDKAVSKWESGLSVPDVGVLLDIAHLFGVTVDYLLENEHEVPVARAGVRKKMSRKHIVVTLLAVALVWLVFTGAFVALNILASWAYPWLLFVYAVPVSCVLLIVFNSLWGNGRLNYLYISLLMWSLLASLFLSVSSSNFWLIFLLGIPGEIIILLWSGITPSKKNEIRL